MKRVFSSFSWLFWSSIIFFIALSIVLLFKKFGVYFDGIGYIWGGIVGVFLVITPHEKCTLAIIDGTHFIFSRFKKYRRFVGGKWYFYNGKWKHKKSECVSKEENYSKEKKIKRKLSKYEYMNPRKKKFLGIF